ncbi:MAG: sigma-70 family RNA polymerase sigma factor, partial [Muricauda sp.]|nr:sigma-70 family RNA polymerase sigma factor [Allomuricauda sp.]
MKENKVDHVIEHLFRNEYGKVVSILVHRYDAAHIEAIEDATQEAFVKAMKVWAYKEIPDNPTGWLYRVANNRLLDQLRRNQKMTFQETEKVPFSEVLQKDTDPPLDDTISDSQLQMIFACCHPALSKEHQIILSLKLIGGFSNKELADALLKKEETVAKSFTRAKKKFRDEVKMVKVPVEMGLQSRLFQVLQVVYLLFSEGYAVTTGSQIIKKDICYEALRLALLLRDNKYCQHPNLEA